jgi:preprotein translocase subunit SecF
VPHGENDAEDELTEPGEVGQVAVASRGTGVVRETHKYAQTSGPRNQPRRPPKSRR